MDFNKFDSVSAAEKGADYHLKHPVSLKPLFDNAKDPTEDNGKPCIVTVLGGEGATVRAANRELQKARAAAETDADQDGEGLSLDDLNDRMVQSMVPRVLGFKGVKNGKVAATKEDALWFFSLNRVNAQEGEMSFVEQVSKFSSQRGSYLGNASAD